MFDVVQQELADGGQKISYIASACTRKPGRHIRDSFERYQSL